jgi:hypothetical protein
VRLVGFRAHDNDDTDAELSKKTKSRAQIWSKLTAIQPQASASLFTACSGFAFEEVQAACQDMTLEYVRRYNPDDPAASRELKFLELRCSAKSPLAERKGERRGEREEGREKRGERRGREKGRCVDEGGGGETIFLTKFHNKFNGCDCEYAEGV